MLILPTLGMVFWETARACVSPRISSENKRIWPHAFPLLLLNSQGESGVQPVHPKKKKTQRLCKLMVAGRRVGEGIVGEFGMHMSTLLYLKWVTNKDLL